jgi:hypothetical protein
MSRATRLPAIFALLVVALLVGLAPLFHAICVAPPAPGSLNAVVTHVMADGTVMAIASTEPSTSAAVADTSGAPLEWMGGLGTILIAAGVAALLILGLRYCRHLLLRLSGIPPRLAVRRSTAPFTRARARSPVDLDALGISRT